MNQMSLGIRRVKVVALAVADLERANLFYGGTLELKPAMENGQAVGFQLEDIVLMLKPVADWYGRPTSEPNPRFTLEVTDARATEKALRERGVILSDAVQDYDGFLVGAFLDSEGNKLWFCSMP